MTSSPSGILTFKIALLEVEYSKLDTRKGKFKSAEVLPELHGLHIFTQDNDRLWHYINGASDYYASRGPPTKKMKIADDITFPTQFGILW